MQFENWKRPLKSKNKIRNQKFVKQVKKAKFETKKKY